MLMYILLITDTNCRVGWARVPQSVHLPVWPHKPDAKNWVSHQWKTRYLLLWKILPLHLKGFFVIYFDIFPSVKDTELTGLVHILYNNQHFDWCSLLLVPNSYKNHNKEERELTAVQWELESRQPCKILIQKNIWSFFLVCLCVSSGVRWYQELQLRLFCRQVLLDPWPNRPECQFWLMRLLKPWPMVSQAHLLFILYGPLLPEGKIAFIHRVNKQSLDRFD